MTTTKSKPAGEPTAHLAAAEAFANSALGPEWLRTLRRNGVTHFTELGFPTTKLEDWIYCNVAPVTKLAFKPAASADTSVTAQQLAPFAFPGWTGSRLVFVNGHFAPALSTLPAPQKGVTITNLAAAIGSGDKLVQAHLAHHASVDGSGFSALNTAFIVDGAFIALAPNAVAAAPVHLLFVSTPGDAANTTQPRNLIVAGANSSAKSSSTTSASAARRTSPMPSRRFPLARVRTLSMRSFRRRTWRRFTSPPCRPRSRATAGSFRTASAPARAWRGTTSTSS